MLTIWKHTQLSLKNLNIIEYNSNMDKAIYLSENILMLGQNYKMPSLKDKWNGLYMKTMCKFS